VSLMQTLARAEAVAGGRAVPAATGCHRHLSEQPLVFVPLTTAGEAGAPLGALVGTDRDAPALLVVPQPLDRDLRFGYFAELAAVVLPYLDSFAEEVETEPAPRGRAAPATPPGSGDGATDTASGEIEVCADAGQIVVPTMAAIEHVRLLGRSTRFLRTADDPDAPYPVPAPLPLLGRWLTHYAERSRTPGSALLLAATDLLTRHWATGQSTLEDQHLGALLGWIDPGPGLDGAAAAARAETARGPDGLLLSPPAGPATDPAFDNRVLAPAMARYDAARKALTALSREGHGDVDAVAGPGGPGAPGSAGGAGGGGARPGATGGGDARPGGIGGTGGIGTQAGPRHRAAAAALAAAEREVRELVASQLRPTWDDVWHALDLLRALPEGAHVAERWKRDRWSFTGHRDRVRAGEPPQPRRDDAITAAQKLAGRETAQARLFAQEALDDPLVMAARRLAGEAFAGEVVQVEMAFSDSRRPMPRPLVTLVTADLPQAEPGAKVYRALPGAKSAQTADLVAIEPAPAPGQAPGQSAHPSGPLAGPGSGSGPGPDATPTPTPTPPRGDGGPSPVRPQPSAAGTDAATAGDEDGDGSGDRGGHPGDAVRATPPVPSALPAQRTGHDGPAAPADAMAPAAWLVTVRLTGGMGGGRTPKEGSVPGPGETVVFTLFEHAPRSGPALPDPENTPWTHGGPPAAALPPSAPAAALGDRDPDAASPAPATASARAAGTGEHPDTGARTRASTGTGTRQDAGIDAGAGTGAGTGASKDARADAPYGLRTGTAPGPAPGSGPGTDPDPVTPEDFL
jgi:hypothetical protein